MTYWLLVITVIGLSNPDDPAIVIRMDMPNETVCYQVANTSNFWSRNQQYRAKATCIAQNRT